MQPQQQPQTTVLQPIVVHPEAAPATREQPPEHKASGDRVVSIENRPASVGSAHLGKLQTLVRGVIP